MKATIFIFAVVFTMATTIPVWANKDHHPSQDKIDSSIMTMEGSRLKMVTTQSLSEQKVLMQEHMQHMKDSMKMMEMMGEKKAKQYDHDIKMRGGQMEIMVEMMRGMISQQEMMMKKSN